MIKIKRFQEITMKVFILNKKKLLSLGLIIILSVIFTSINTVVLVSQNNPKKIPIYSVARPDSKIALTFNCAWGCEDISKILDTLDKYKIKATFFIVGRWAEKYPEELKEIDKRGHEIGAHSYNHAHYKDMSYEEILKDMEKCDVVIENVIGKDIFYVRGGYGEYNDSVIKACEDSGRTYIQWSTDSLDYKLKSPEEILNRVIKNTSSGDIILMHTGTEYTKDALDSILLELLKNYEPVKISDLIFKENYTIDHTGKQIKDNV